MTDQVVTPFETQVTEVVAAPDVTVTPVVQDQVTAPTFQIPETVKGLVGEGMKYATPEAALESLPHAQHHIERLEEEMASMREDLSKRTAVEDVLKEINKTPTEIQAEPQLTQDQLDALIDTRLATKEANDLSKSNVTEVVNKFITLYGDKDKAQAIYKQKATDLGMSVEAVNNLAATSPKAVFELFGIKPNAELPATKLNTNINSEAVVTTNVQEQKPASVMGASTHAQDVAAWKSFAPTE
jgi:uncharacterized coiled-coil protein SlyX